MSNVTTSQYNLRLLDDLARLDSSIHRIHPLIKLMTTIIYLVVVVSFGKYEILGLLPLLFYPVVIIALAELPLWPIVKRILWVEPLIIGIGILNPWFDQQVFTVGGLVLSKGWLTFLAICCKGGLTVTAAILLIATTGMDGVAAALRLLRVPRVFVLQLLLTYRYVAVLSGEVGRVLVAYSLRAPRDQGIRWPVLGSLIGQVLLRTFDRAERIYQAMCLRGFAGEYHTGRHPGIRLWDIAYGGGWVLFFGLARAYNLPLLIGVWLTGGGQ